MKEENVSINRIGIVGAGVMGCGIAEVCARAQLDVILRDVNSSAVESGLRQIEKNVNRSVEKGKTPPAEAPEILARIRGAESDSDLSTCDLVIEAASERMVAKKEIFARLDAVCSPAAVLATNTSALSITEIASATASPRRVIGLHFFNPVPVMALVEVIRGVHTDPESHRLVVEFVRKIGKTPVGVVESPGFLVNRMLVPMINEAVGILAEGVASAEAIDTAMTLGANHPIGPLGLADLIGNDVCLAIMETLHSEFGDPKYRPHPLLRKKVRGGLLGRKSGEGFFKY